MDPDPVNFPLHAAAARGAPKAELRHLLDAGCQPNSFDNNGNSALHVAAIFGKTACAVALVGLGAQLSAANTRGQTAKDVARAHGHMDVAQFLEDLEPTPSASSGAMHPGQQSLSAMPVPQQTMPPAGAGSGSSSGSGSGSASNAPSLSWENFGRPVQPVAASLARTPSKSWEDFGLANQQPTRTPSSASAGSGSVPATRSWENIGAAAQRPSPNVAQVPAKSWESFAATGAPAAPTVAQVPATSWDNFGATGLDPWAQAATGAQDAKDPWDVAWTFGLDDDDSGSNKLTSSPAANNSLDEKERRRTWREAALNEVISSETTYVKELEVIVDVYMERFEEPSSPVPPRSRKILFSNVRNILVLNQRLLTEIKYKQSNGESFIESLHNFVPYLRMYQEYINNYEHASRELADLSSSNKEFAVFLESCDGTNGTSLTLRDFLIVPVQRIPRYRLLLAEVLKHTPSDVYPEEHNLLDDALRSVAELASTIDDELRKHQSRSKVVSIANEVGSKELITPTRLFVHEGFLDKISRHGPQRRKFVLFNDLLCYMEPPGVLSSGYKLNRSLPLDEIYVVDRVDAQEEFIILSREKSFSCRADTPADKASWVERIREAQTKISARRNQSAKGGVTVSNKVSVIRNGQVRQLEIGSLEQRVLHMASRGQQKLQIGDFQSVQGSSTSAKRGLVGSLLADGEATSEGASATRGKKPSAALPPMSEQSQSLLDLEGLSFELDASTAAPSVPSSVPPLLSQMVSPGQSGTGTAPFSAANLSPTRSSSSSTPKSSVNVRSNSNAAMPTVERQHSPLGTSVRPLPTATAPAQAQVADLASPETTASARAPVRRLPPKKLSEAFSKSEDKSSESISTLPSPQPMNFGSNPTTPPGANLTQQQRPVAPNPNPLSSNQQTRPAPPLGYGGYNKTTAGPRNGGLRPAEEPVLPSRAGASPTTARPTTQTSLSETSAAPGRVRNAASALRHKIPMLVPNPVTAAQGKPAHPVQTNQPVSAAGMDPFGQQTQQLTPSTSSVRVPNNGGGVSPQWDPFTSGRVQPQQNFAPSAEQRAGAISSMDAMPNPNAAFAQRNVSRQQNFSADAFSNIDPFAKG